MSARSLSSAAWRARPASPSLRSRSIVSERLSPFLAARPTIFTISCESVREVFNFILLTYSNADVGGNPQPFAFQFRITPVFGSALRYSRKRPSGDQSVALGDVQGPTSRATTGLPVALHFYLELRAESQGAGGEAELALAV